MKRLVMGSVEGFGGRIDSFTYFSIGEAHETVVWNKLTYQCDQIFFYHCYDNLRNKLYKTMGLLNRRFSGEYSGYFDIDLIQKVVNLE